MTLDQFRQTRREVPCVFKSVGCGYDETSAGWVYCSNPDKPDQPTVYIEKSPYAEGYLQIGSVETLGTLHELERQLYAYCLTELHFGEI